MKLRIHGDNIIESERALSLIAHAYNANVVAKNENIIVPSYSILNKDKEIFEVELLGGHDRWNVNFNTELTKYGAPLREATDAYITKVSKDNKTEELLFAIEFCNALPAGNNAWQRNGRAVTCAEIGIPYFYFAEIGGVELDGDRKVKAPRFPNPIVPFSYLTSSKSLNVVCVPIYEAHPAITNELRKKFTHIFGKEASLNLLKLIIEQSQTNNAMDILIEKGTTLVKILSEDRKRVDTFRASEWEEFLKISSGQKKAEWIKNHPDKQIWRKKTSDKVNVTFTFKTLLRKTQELNLLSIGAKEIPICLVANGNVKKFTSLLKEIYPSESINDLANKIKTKNKPLIIVWVTGFKPRGDDSRPDRGLVPLARMLFGNDIDILTIVFGPAGKQTWKSFNENPAKLVTGNGLWQAVLNLSNYVLVDSATSEFGVLTSIVNRDLERKNVKVVFNSAKPSGNFGEHDVDTAIHTLFSRQLSLNIFESMCNPPGGDWSGISYFDFSDKTEYRWTSLPRVSATKAKRPDHIIQIHTKKEEVFLVIESKNNAKDLDENIGERLTEYVNVLLKIPPTAHKPNKQDWQSFTGKKSPLNNAVTYSGGSFVYRSSDEMKTKMQEGKLDFVFAFEFKKDGIETIGHLLLSDKSQFLNRIFTDIVSQFNGSFKIKIY
ncbi:MAG: hypothetical protein IPO14_11005 [Saprospiraceae bacterium]|nr:hypothetical protein [Saprospiraceae bacterium]